ncbi:McrB family protein [Nautilia sp.]
MYNKIFYGSPGVGKSYKINNLTYGNKKYITTFHPEYSYFDFIGTYKPITNDDNKTIYKFIPQVFLKAYIEAWKNLNKNVFLIIEEINRGNCAQIFGDIFQLLDRDELGFSKYFIDVSDEIQTFLKEKLKNNDYSIRIRDLFYLKNGIYLKNDEIYSKILLPNNLFLLATMNTSDQSLFPMDSAFKRRWEWEYIPIDYSQANNIKIRIDDNIQIDWKNFIQKVNKKILEITGTVDKQIGVWFIMPKNNFIEKDIFINKVLFYLWEEIFKDEDEDNNIFITTSGELITFEKIFHSQDFLIEFLKANQFI